MLKKEEGWQDYFGTDVWVQKVDLRWLFWHPVHGWQDMARQEVFEQALEAFESVLRSNSAVLPVTQREYFDLQKEFNRTLIKYVGK